MYRFSADFSHPGYADSRPDAVIILPLMAHDKHQVARFDEFPDSLGNNAGADAGILFHGPGLSAIKMGRPIFFIDDDLIAAAPKGQVKTRVGLVSQFIEIGFPFCDDIFGKCGYAHADRDRNAVDRMDRTDLFQEREIILLQCIQCFPAQAGNIVVIAIRADKGVMSRQGIDEAVIDIGPECSLLYGCHPLSDFFHVINGNVAEHRHRSQTIQFLLFCFRDIFKIQYEIVVFF